MTHEDFGKDYGKFLKNCAGDVSRWEKWEGPSKYIFLVVEK